MTETIEKTAQSIEKSQFGIYSIEKDYNRYTVRITRQSKGRYHLGVKIVHYVGFNFYKDISMKVMRMNMFVEKFINDENQRQAEKKAQKLAVEEARKEFKNPYHVGQILYRSWGY